MERSTKIKRLFRKQGDVRVKHIMIWENGSIKSYAYLTCMKNTNNNNADIMEIQNTLDLG